MASAAATSELGYSTSAPSGHADNELDRMGSEGENSSFRSVERGEGDEVAFVCEEMSRRRNASMRDDLLQLPRTSHHREQSKR